MYENIYKKHTYDYCPRESSRCFFLFFIILFFFRCTMFIQHMAMFHRDKTVFSALIFFSVLCLFLYMYKNIHKRLVNFYLKSHLFNVSATAQMIFVLNRYAKKVRRICNNEKIMSSQQLS